MASEIALHIAARCWGDDRLICREMDADLAEVFAERLDKLAEYFDVNLHELGEII